jgi:hypothetical protein
MTTVNHPSLPGTCRVKLKAEVIRILLRKEYVQIAFFIYMFLVNQRFIFHNFLLYCPSQRSARSQVPSQVATHQEICSQLWAGETRKSNQGLQDTILAHYH